MYSDVTESWGSEHPRLPHPKLQLPLLLSQGRTRPGQMWSAVSQMWAPLRQRQWERRERKEEEGPERTIEESECDRRNLETITPPNLDPLVGPRLTPLPATGWPASAMGMESA